LAVTEFCGSSLTLQNHIFSPEHTRKTGVSYLVFKHLLALGFVGLFAAAVAKSGQQVRSRQDDDTDPIVEFHATISSEMVALKLPAYTHPYGFLRRAADFHPYYSVN